MNVGIAGAGIMGSLLAFSLREMGYDVTIYDKSVDDNCSNAAAGLLTPVSELEKNDEIIFELGMASLKNHWPRILKKLDGDIYFRHEGSVVIAHPLDAAELINFTNIITERLPENNSYQKIDQHELAVLEPELSGFTSGYYIRDEGQIDNQHLLQALRDKMLAEDVVIKNENVLNVSSGNIETKNGGNTFDLTCDCRGLGMNGEIRGVRGELIWLWAPDVVISRPVRLMHPRYKLYISPRPGNIYLVGASEIESEDTSNISVRTMLELLTAVYCIHPKFAEARIVKTVTQCRPTLPDNLPRIKYADRYVAINGLYRHGFLIAPSLVDEVIKWITQGVSALRYPQLWE